MLGTTLSKTASKDINRVLADTEKKLSVATNESDIQKIQQEALTAVKARFNRFASSLSPETLSKTYKTKLSGDWMAAAHDDFIKDLSD